MTAKKKTGEGSPTGVADDCKSEKTENITKERCRELYLTGQYKAAYLAQLAGKSERTIYNWKKKWDKDKPEIKQLRVIESFSSEVIEDTLRGIYGRWVDLMHEILDDEELSKKDKVYCMRQFWDTIEETRKTMKFTEGVNRGEYEVSAELVRYIYRKLDTKDKKEVLQNFGDAINVELER